MKRLINRLIQLVITLIGVSFLTFCLNQNSQNITIPKVINQINDSTKYGFVMEYFRANDFILFLEISLIEEILIKIKYLIEFVDENIKSSPITVIDKNVILKKFKEVEENINKRFFDKFVNILNLIEIKLNRMSDNISLPLGLCHGDLTFSNVLVQNEKIVLIDFLDSFIEKNKLYDSKHKNCKLFHLMMNISTLCE